jgi:sec-independent protein translocase protein TatA
MGLGALQPMHLIVVLVIVLLVFGPGKLPELGRAVGDGLRELKKATSGGDDKDKTEALAAASTTSTVTPISVAPSAPTMASRPCPSCRGAVPVGDKFCGNCGTTMEAVSRSA